MRCKDVKQWMSEKKGIPDAAVLEHLSRCPECARMVQADRRLNDLFEASAGVEQVPSFEAMRRRVESLAGDPTIQEKVMSYIKDQVRTRPRLLAGAGLAVLAFLFITLVPLSYTHTTGYTISVTDSGDENDVTLQKVEKVITEADAENATVVVVSEGDIRRFIVTPVTTRVVADRIAVMLKDEIKDRVEVTVEPIVRIKSDPIYAQVVSRVKTTDKKSPRVKISLPRLLFDSDDILKLIQDFDLDDAQVEGRLADQLLEQGLSGEQFEVSSETDEDVNTRTIKLLLLSEDAEGGQAELEFIVGVGKPDKDQKNIAVRLKSGKVMNVEVQEDEEADGDIIILRMNVEDSLK